MKHITKIIISVSVIILLILGLIVLNETKIDVNRIFENSTTQNTFKNIVDPKDLIAGGPPKDGIPSIDDPKFVRVDESNWPDDAEIFLLEGKDIIKAYPQPILVWHEIVNDFIDDVPVMVTYCPLCGSSIAYLREINGEAAEFGTSGKLYNSNLVMYDRLTDSYWTQIKGEAIIGELSGYVLEKIPLQFLTWREVKENFPDALVLSRETGINRNYNQDPYSNYYTSDDIYFPVSHSSSLLDSKTIIIGINIDGDAKAYPEFIIKEQKIIRDEVGTTSITIKLDEVGFITIEDDEGNNIFWERDFWFAWFAFHPETEIHSK